MAQVHSIAQRTPASAPAERSASPWAMLTDAQRDCASERIALIRPALDRIQAGVSERKAAAWLVATHQMDVSADTVERWLAAYRKGGPTALATGNTGRRRQDYGWEAQAIELYNTHSNRSAATVAYKLQKAGFASATASRVSRYINTLPSTLGQCSPARIGPHEHKLRFGKYRIRHLDDLLPGDCYQADGHKCDAYVAHPDTGHPIRPELITWMDVKSRKIVGLWMCEDESQQNVLFSFASALILHDHVPALVHTDNGKFKDAMATHNAAGYFARFGIEHIKGIPGNPHGKAHKERFFGIFEERFGKDWDTYCGPHAAHEHNRRLTVDLKAGRRRLPTFAEYAEKAKAWLLNDYNNDVRDVMDRLSPNQVWDAGFQRSPLIDEAVAVLRPRVVRRARNTMVQLHGRWYQHDELINFNPADVLVEYDLHKDESVRVLTMDGQLICIAGLVKREAYLSQSRIDDAKAKREVSAVKRLQLKADERIARARGAIPTTAAGIMTMSLDAPAMPLEITVTPVNRAVLAELEAEHAPEPQVDPSEMPEGRFARALRLQRDGASNEADASWLRIYTASAEYQSRLMLLEEFGESAVAAADRL